MPGRLIVGCIATAMLLLCPQVSYAVIWKTSDGGNRHFYMTTQTIGAWTNAEAEAVARGGHLVSINSGAEQNFVAATFPKELWIGLTDEVSEGTFAWTSGEPVEFTYWAAGEPNDQLGVEDYVVTRSPLGGRWNDVPVAGPFMRQVYGLIEIDPYSILLGSPLRVETGLPSNSTTASWTHSVGGPVIRATFSPRTENGPVDLDKLAMYLGIKSFNWVQTVSGPGNTRLEIWNDVANDNNGDLIAGNLVNGTPVPTYDPVVQSELADSYVIRVDGNALNDVRRSAISTNQSAISPWTEGPIADDLPFYYAEFAGQAYDMQVNPDNPSVHSDSSLSFIDQPRVADWILSGSNGQAAPGFFLSFRTELVGVNFDNSIRHFDVPGLAFSWKSNAVWNGNLPGAGGVRQLLGQGASTGGPATSSGGIFDVTLEGVPEPSSWSLASAVIMILVVACRTTNRNVCNRKLWTR